SLFFQLRAVLHLVSRAPIESANLGQQRVPRRRDTGLVLLIEAELFVSLAGLAERAIRQRQCIMRGSKLRKQFGRLAVSHSRARKLAPGRADSPQTVVSVSVIGVLLHDLGIEHSARVPLRGGKQAVGEP